MHNNFKFEALEKNDIKNDFEKRFNNLNRNTYIKSKNDILWKTTFINFTYDELKCPCCNKMDIHTLALKNLQSARIYATIEYKNYKNDQRTTCDIPFHVNSAYRCERHNKEIGGANKSYHVKGLAFDIDISNPEHAFFIVDALTNYFTRAYLYKSKNFIHVDLKNDVRLLKVL